MGFQLSQKSARGSNSIIAYNAVMRRTLKFENLEDRRVMAGLPFGASDQDTGEFMLGRIAVTPVFIESNGLGDASTEDWTESQKADVLSNIQTGLNWWKQLLAKKSSVTTLDFVVDTTFVQSPFSSQYEPITRRSDDYSLWVDEFMVAQGYSQSGLLENNVRAFNNAQRSKLQSDWSFTIFVVNSKNDADGMFAPNGSFSRAFSFAGGLFEVVPSTRPAMTFAHETGHMFWARDEYTGGSTYYQRRGYYNTQNTNAMDLNPNSGFVQEDSIMSDGPGQLRAYNNVTSPASTLAHIGWQDSDNDGIFDVLDVPLKLQGSGRFDPAKSQYLFRGNASVQTLPNLNGSGAQNNITLNQVGRIEYRINQGAWQTILTPSAYSTDLDLAIPIPSGSTGTVEIRAIDPRIGIVSNSFQGALTGAGSTTQTSGVYGFAWNDLNTDGVWQTLESGISGATVRLLNRDGTLARTQTVIRPDDLPAGKISNPVSGTSMTAIGMDTDGKLSIASDMNAELGKSVIQPFAYSVQSYRPYFQGTDEQLKLAFATPTSYASVHIVAAEGSAIGRLDAYDSNGKILTRYESASLATNTSTWLEVQSDQPIAYVIAYGHRDTKIKIDQIRYGLPGDVTTGNDGSYLFPSVPAGSFSVRVLPPAGFESRVPADGISNVVVSAAAPSIRADFSQLKLTSPWQNPTLKYDVNNDGLISLFDVLVVINDINRTGARQLLDSERAPPPFIDVDGNRIVEALDVLIVINYINSHLASGEGEGTLPRIEDPLSDASISGAAPIDMAMADGNFWSTDSATTSRRRRG